MSDSSSSSYSAEAPARANERERERLARDEYEQRRDRDGDASHPPGPGSRPASGLGSGSGSGSGAGALAGGAQHDRGESRNPHAGRDDGDYRSSSSRRSADDADVNNAASASRPGSSGADRSRGGSASADQSGAARSGTDDHHQHQHQDTTQHTSPESVRTVHYPAGRSGGLLPRPDASKLLPQPQFQQQHQRNHQFGNGHRQHHQQVDVPRNPTDATTQMVASHYNARPILGYENRDTSEIFHLRQFNNWVKSVMNLTYVSRGDHVLDLCCGKGGDLQKYRVAGVKRVIGADVAENAIAECRQRAANINNLPYTYQFFVADCFSVRLRDYYPPPPQQHPRRQGTAAQWFDVTNCQFAFHYSFETEAKARTFLLNASERLVEGGKLLITTPSADRIVDRLRAVEGWEFSNPVFSIKFNPSQYTDKETFPIFGAKYTFSLQEAIEDCPEFLVHLGTLYELAAEYGLEVNLVESFHQFFERNKDRHGDLLVKNKVLPLSQDEWDVVGLYDVIALTKRPHTLHLPVFR
ncbi:mRNA cap guanine-N7 methyltransferase 1 [Capsaspora owczarzaki ATCC 30864]|uniref:mRNA (guanine-N(7))-methyltransferase n=1 Tax=Capsaspora owczarzaki (strain ATCC 30864) TaxID=595528 RepID=A0A0D2VYV5_CAPO3|nr:mRNA cap guanine-N7 methyltransferase 1 [Capsaspora owczarzaki ATCC 30864]KJE96942.1 mRNA cap guanine-N7 methyltransferase 1 [Capsaspora owczarzaki ATCC 30864]|eukprot:XP_004343911.2 mRNA cap guanine-N7 methyltransferase 1 [Capsaspora owczarzaki ATCC 30864]